MGVALVLCYFVGVILFIGFVIGGGVRDWLANREGVEPRLSAIEAAQRITDRAVETSVAMYEEAIRQHATDPVRHNSIGRSAGE